MWRNSLNSSSRLLLSSANPNPKPFLSSLSLSHSYLYSLIRTGASSPSSSSSSSSSPGSVNPGFHRSNALPAFRFAPESMYPWFGSPSALQSLRLGSSVTSLPLPAASASNARDVLDLARHYGRCYWELSKAKLSMLVVATSGAGFVLGSVNAVDVPGLCLTCAGTMMAAASANSLNQVFEIDNDAKMKRTRLRPLPSGRITVPHAIAWASSMGLAGTTLLACKANVLAAGLAASNIVLYAFVYTPLKQIHPVNTWVGAVVGAIPPLLGWAAASGDVSLNAWILPATLYFWQIPHFMSLAYLCRDDYAAGGFRMFSLADASGHRTALVTLRNCIYLAPLGFLTYHLGVASGWFCLESSLLALAMTAAAFKFWRSRTPANARRMFHASLLYLPAFMSGLLFHRLSVNDHSSLIENNAETISNEFSHFSITSAPESEYVGRKGGTRSLTSPEARPPVSYASVAPFPFLPAPCYATF